MGVLFLVCCCGCVVMGVWLCVCSGGCAVAGVLLYVCSCGCAKCGCALVGVKCGIRLAQGGGRSAIKKRRIIQTEDLSDSPSRLYLKTRTTPGVVGIKIC